MTEVAEPQAEGLDDERALRRDECPHCKAEVESYADVEYARCPLCLKTFEFTAETQILPPEPKPKKVLRLKLPKMYPKQAAFCNDPHPITVCFASTKSGKSSGLLMWGLGKSWATGGPEKDGYWLAPSYGVAKIMFRRLTRWLLKTDPDMRIWAMNESELFVTLHNRGKIWFKGAERPDMLYGPDAIWVVIDEGTRCKEDTFIVATSITTKTGGQIKIIGNMKSRGQWMYKLWMRGRQGDPDIGWHVLDAWDAVDGGVLSRDVVLKAQRTMPERAFKALYLCEPDDDEGNPFGIEAIRRRLLPQDDKGRVIFSTKPAQVYGVDLAKSVDYTEVVGLDKHGVPTEYEFWQGPWTATLARIPAIIGKKTWTLVDSTGVGDPILEQLQKKTAKAKGYKFSAQSKQKLMEGLAVAIQQGTVMIVPGRMQEQLEVFEYEYTATGVRYSAPDGMHDDAVMALALAVMMQSTLPAGSVVVAAEGAGTSSPYEDDGTDMVD